MPESLPPDYFDDVYARHDDPWDFETSEYEMYKYAETLRTLPRPHYARVLEIGCSIGVLSCQLAERCGALLAVDVADAALQRARARCGTRPNVWFEKMNVPDQFPDGLFDLIVVSEVAYYWSRDDLKRAMELIAEHQSAGAELLLVHWTPVVPDYPQTGDAVHDAWLKRPEWKHRTGERREKYRIDLLQRL